MPSRETMNGLYTTDGTGLAIPIGVRSGGNMVPAGLRTVKLFVGGIYTGATYTVWMQHNSLEPVANPTTWTDVYAQSVLANSENVTAGALTQTVRNLCSYTTDTKSGPTYDRYDVQIFLAPGWARGRIIVAALASGDISCYMAIF